jgi:hypothetical protein
MGGERTFRRLISAPRNGLILLRSMRGAKILNGAPMARQKETPSQAKPVTG